MATTRRELSQKVNSAGQSEIIVRLSVARGIQPRLRTGLYIAPSRFRDGRIIRPRADRAEAARLQKIEAELTAIEQHLLHIATTTPREGLSREYLRRRLQEYLHPTIQTSTDRPFYELFDRFLSVNTFSEWRVKRYNVLRRALHRYEAWRTACDGISYSLQVTTFTTADIVSFENFLRHEHKICADYPGIYREYHTVVGKSTVPLPRGNNTIINLLNALRAFFNWCYNQEITSNRPFARYNGITAELYGTPYYITIDERNTIAGADLTGDQRLATQRDIFIFQCLIGCRVSDLMRLTTANIIDGAVEYIAGKTRQNHPEVIRVPLHPQAAAIVSRYPDLPGGKLLPFTSAQRYNDSIKQIFTRCGITRPVTILNPLTGLEEQRPINEIATSHLARRTFVGNLYKKVKDPCLVGRLSGHKDGSKAFARYRDIDEEMKRDLISLL